MTIQSTVILLTEIVLMRSYHVHINGEIRKRIFLNYSHCIWGRHFDLLKYITQFYFDLSTVEQVLFVCIYAWSTDSMQISSYNIRSSNLEQTQPQCIQALFPLIRSTQSTQIVTRQQSMPHMSTTMLRPIQQYFTHTWSLKGDSECLLATQHRHL